MAARAGRVGRRHVQDRLRGQPAAVAGPLTAAELTAAYRARELSPVEAAEAALARIEARDGELNAFCLVDGERALADARASEQRWARGEPAGPLDGVPVGVKDLLVTRGWPTLRGSPRDRPGRPVGGRRAGRRRAAPLRRRAPRQDDDARAGLEGRHRQRAGGRHAQPVGPVEDAGRLERRQRRRARRRHGAARARHRRRRLDPDPVRLQRPAGAQADVRPRAGLAGQPVRAGLARRPDGAHGHRRSRCCST